MKLTVTTLSDRLFTLEVSEDMELENFKALCELESGIKPTEMSVIWNGRPLQNDKSTLKAYGVNDGDMLLLQHIRGPLGVASSHTSNPSGQLATGLGVSPGHSGLPVMDFSNIQVPGNSRHGGSQSQPGNSRTGGSLPQAVEDDPAYVRDMLLANQHELAIIKERNPPLADALLSGSLEKFTEVFRKQQAERMEKEKERIQLLTANPFDPDVQKRIAEEIRLKNVESNMETAMEYAPESFGQVIMLYVDCHVNGHPVKAFVDSGAQMTIMSQACAERCNIMRLVDSRWAGIAKGVGTQKIIGRIHLCQIQIGSIFLQSSFSVLENQPMDMLLGLDMLKRHQCCIDLKRNVLVIGTTDTETRFLTESELPEHARLNFNPLGESRSSLEMEDKELAEALSKSAQESDTKSSSTSSIQSNPSTSSSSSNPSPYPQAVIKQLMSYGFTEQQVLEELQKSQGNVDQALAALFAKSLNMP